jgi:lipopolysaccharide export system permease protein
LFWLLAYYSLLSLGKALGDKGFLHPVPALWLPNVVVGAIATHLFTKAVRESPLRAQAWFDAAIGWTGKRWTGFRKRELV